jgi:hypothetical protein
VPNVQACCQHFPFFSPVFRLHLAPSLFFAEHCTPVALAFVGGLQTLQAVSFSDCASVTSTAFVCVEVVMVRQLVTWYLPPLGVTTTFCANPITGEQHEMIRNNLMIFLVDILKIFMKNNASEKIDDQDTSSCINKLTEDPIVRSYGVVQDDNFTDEKHRNQICFDAWKCETSAGRNRSLTVWNV